MFFWTRDDAGKKSDETDSCRLYGSFYVNKVAGNFHITVGKYEFLPSYFEIVRNIWREAWIKLHIDECASGAQEVATSKMRRQRG